MNIYILLFLVGLLGLIILSRLGNQTRVITIEMDQSNTGRDESLVMIAILAIGVFFTFLIITSW